MSSEEKRNGTKFIWKTVNFSCYKRNALVSPPFKSHSVWWNVRISTSTLEDTEVINIGLYTESPTNEIFNFSLAFIDSKGFPLISRENNKIKVQPRREDFFGWSGNVAFNNFIEKSELLGSRKNTILPNDTLIVKCLVWVTPEDLLLPLKFFARTRIELSGQITFNDNVSENEILTNTPHILDYPIHISKPCSCTDDHEIKQPSVPDDTDSLPQALQDMYEDSFFSDFILKIGSKEYPVHKSVLGARSLVFKAMFTTDMKEKDANFVDIKDVDEDTLQRLLRFVYSDRVEDKMEWDSALKLYSAADMYALKTLQRKCSAILRSGLSVSNVLQVCKLADMHQDQDLESTSLDFISSNDSEIIGTQSWLMFEKENGSLAAEMLRKLYLKKLKG